MVVLTVDVPDFDVDIEVLALNEKLDVDVETMVIEVIFSFEILFVVVVLTVGVLDFEVDSDVVGVMEKLRLEKGGVGVSIVLPGLGMVLVENQELPSQVEVLLLIVVVPRGIDVSPTDAVELPKIVEVLLMLLRGHCLGNGPPTSRSPSSVGGC